VTDRQEAVGWLQATLRLGGFVIALAQTVALPVLFEREPSMPALILAATMMGVDRAFARDLRRNEEGPR
jgi:hypothetical protein